MQRQWLPCDSPVSSVASALRSPTVLQLIAAKATRPCSWPHKNYLVQWSPVPASWPLHPWGPVKDPGPLWLLRLPCCSLSSEHSSEFGDPGPRDWKGARRARCLVSRNWVMGNAGQGQDQILGEPGYLSLPKGQNKPSILHRPVWAE